MEWMQWILSADREIFLWVQQTGASEGIDRFMLLLRKPATWIPFYAFLLYWVIRYARPFALPFLILTAVCAGLADFSSASIFKPLIGRPRPCYEPALKGFVRELVGCGGQYGFPSSHASNHFALATFWYWAIYILRGQRWNWLFVWAFLIGYAQVYVGKHYPLDIVGGAALGIFIGTFGAKLFEWWFNRGQARKSTEPYPLH